MMKIQVSGGGGREAEEKEMGERENLNFLS